MSCFAWSDTLSFLSQTFSAILAIHHLHYHSHPNRIKAHLSNASLCRYCCRSCQSQVRFWHNQNLPNQNRLCLVWYCCLQKLCFSLPCPTGSRIWHPSTSIRYTQSALTTSKTAGTTVIQSSTYGCQEHAVTMRSRSSFQTHHSSAAVPHCFSNLAKMICLILRNLDFPISH